MNPKTAWLMLVTAGLLEIFWASSLKSTQGFTKLGPSIAVALAMMASFYLLSQSLKVIPMSVAYAVWVGIGAAGTAAVGMIWFNEPRDLGRVLCVLLIVAGVAGLRLLSP